MFRSGDALVHLVPCGGGWFSSLTSVATSEDGPATSSPLLLELLKETPSFSTFNTAFPRVFILRKDYATADSYEGAGVGTKRDDAIVI